MFDCLVTQHDIKVAKDMFGPNLGSLKGKTNWRKVKHVRSQVDPVRNLYAKLGPFFSASSFNHNFQPNNNQTFIVYVKSTLVLYRKGLCGFFSVLGFALEEKLCGAKCC